MPSGRRSFGRRFPSRKARWALGRRRERRCLRISAGSSPGTPRRAASPSAFISAGTMRGCAACAMRTASCPSWGASGFERVTLKGMPMAAQVQFFRQAEAIVGAHGAGLAHTAWCKPGTKVIEFFPGLGGPRGRPEERHGQYVAHRHAARADAWLLPGRAAGIAVRRLHDPRRFAAARA